MMQRPLVSLWSRFRERPVKGESDFVGVGAYGCWAVVELSGDFVADEALLMELFELGLLLFGELFHCCLRVGAFAKAVAAASEMVEWFF
ncbi:MAG: hypothetical protein ABF792_08660 [Bifidobacterium psychraerophilum]|jgi:hypothetical protein|uniref:hypothetical protein n=1 Tax=Bifidobacterium psychraerophilum TaxID=218140 RepID=UPI0039ECAFF5